MARLNSTDLVLQLRDALPVAAVQFIATSLSAVPCCAVSTIPYKESGTYLRVAVQLSSVTGKQGTPPYSAAAVLQATAWVEDNAQASAELQMVLQNKGLLQSAKLSPTQATSGTSGRPQKQPARATVQPAALSPAGPGAAPSSGPQGHALKQQLKFQSQRLIPLLQRCGILVSVYPEHDPQVLSQLRGKVWGGFLAPVTEFRYYFGDQVGFYLAYLNALTCWLLAPAAASSFLLWALGPTGLADRTGLSSPLIPIMVIFQLLWSAAGVKLWRRHQAILDKRWHPSSISTRTSAAAAAATNQQQLPPAGSPTGSCTGLGAESKTPARTHDCDDVQGQSGVGSVVSLGAAASRQASLSYSHFRGGVPEWAVRAPTATGTRWQFSGVWRRDAKGHWQLQAALVPQLLRLGASITATTLLLLVAAGVLTTCLNLQGLIASTHTLLYTPWLGALSAPGGVLADGLLKQVPMVVRVLAVSLYDSIFFGPAAKVLTGFENRRTLEGFDASLTAKKAALLFLFTFAPVAYVGLAGAGAAAAATDAAGYFKFELLRRLIMEFVMPWVSLLLATQRQAASKRRAAQPAGTTGTVTATATATARDDSIAHVSGAVVTAADNDLRGSSTVGSSVRAAFHTADSSQVAGQAPGRAAPGVAGRPSVAEPTRGSVAEYVADGDVLRPPFDSFTGTWDVTRDMGYVMLFASILPWAAPLTLLYTLAKIKQDCMSLLLVYQRPMPRQMRNLGSWNTVLLVQVFVAVVTNVFLSGLSSGQLAQLLPTWLVPAGLSYSLTAAAAVRPTDSTATATLGHAATDWALNPLDTLGAISSGIWYPSGSYRSNLGPFSVAPDMCPVPTLYDSGFAVCPVGHPSLQPPVLHAAPAHGGDKSMLAMADAESSAATSHMLLLFGLEHLVLLLVVLVLKLVPDEPGTHGSRQAPAELKALPATSGGTASTAKTVSAQPQPQQKQPMLRQQVPTLVTTQAVVQQQPARQVVVTERAHLAPVASVHGNPLFSQSTARKSKAV